MSMTLLLTHGVLCEGVPDLKEVTPEAMQMVKRNFEWVAERVKVQCFTKLLLLLYLSVTFE